MLELSIFTNVGTKYCRIHSLNAGKPSAQSTKQQNLCQAKRYIQSYSTSKPCGESEQSARMLACRARWYPNVSAGNFQELLPCARYCAKMLCIDRRLCSGKGKRDHIVYLRDEISTKPTRGHVSSRMRTRTIALTARVLKCRSSEHVCHAQKSMSIARPRSAHCLRHAHGVQYLRLHPGDWAIPATARAEHAAAVPVSVLSTLDRHPPRGGGAAP
jgi:hypothetical protein